MCGIAGVIGPLAEREVVAGMIRAIAHRGPDGQAVLGGTGFMLGHARLAIIDIAGGLQPMSSQSGRWLLSLNGEIYNYRELRQEIGDRYQFVTSSDSEVILAAVETYGLNRGLECIDGMYALALIDRQEGRLYLARDHFGIKPLYYTRPAAGGLAFASEIKALLPLGISPDIDQTALITQLLCRFIPAPYTGRRGVFKLRPGECLGVQMAEPFAATTQRIVPRAATLPASEETPLELTAQLLSAAVRRQTVADVPVGMLLSGGVDSALVAKLALPWCSLKTYCVGYGADDAATEIAEATETARVLGTKHCNLQVERRDFANELRHAIWHLEEPVATTSLVSYSLLCEAVAKAEKVVLSGQGADEPWAGYSRHRFEANLDRYGFWMRALAPMGAVLELAHSKSRTSEALGAMNNETLRWIAYRALFPIERIRRVFGVAATEAALHRIEESLRWADGQAPNAAHDSFSRLLVRDCFTDLSDNLLLLADKLSMAYGLEVRVPMLDVGYATHVLQLPRPAKRAGLLMGQGKVLHKQVALRSLPAPIVYRPKRGFETPLRRWLASDFGREVRDSVLSSRSALAAVLPAADLFESPPALGNVSHELQQQLFSLWVTNQWLDILH